jgi:16S rRNA processing protein RimM
MTRVGQVLAPYGLDGAVKVLSLTDFDDRFAAGSRLVIEGDEKVVEWSRNAGGDLVVKLRGIDNRTMAQLFRGRYFEIGEEAARPAGEGRFYHHQVVGLAVSTTSGQDLGRIAEVLERPANDVWVSREGALEHLIPATRDAVVEVDLAAGRVVVADWLVQVQEA